MPEVLDAINAIVNNLCVREEAIDR